MMKDYRPTDEKPDHPDAYKTSGSQEKMTTDKV